MIRMVQPEKMINGNDDDDDDDDVYDNGALLHVRNFLQWWINSGRGEDEIGDLNER